MALIVLVFLSIFEEGEEDENEEENEYVLIAERRRG